MTPQRSSPLLLVLLMLSAAAPGCLDQAESTTVESTSTGADITPTAAQAGPSLPGQAAFGAFQEILAILEADPATDWSKVRLDLLREHLIDMAELTLHAQADQRDLEDGVHITISGEGRVRDAIRRMVPTHTAVTLADIPGWQAHAEATDTGAILTVTAVDSREVVHIQALGFLGLMATGSQHPAHHLLLARGEMTMDHAGMDGSSMDHDTMDHSTMEH